jgi:hypothetical protein
MSAFVTGVVIDIRDLTIHDGPGRRLSEEAEKTLRDAPMVGHNKDCSAMTNTLIPHKIAGNPGSTLSLFPTIMTFARPLPAQCKGPPAAGFYSDAIGISGRLSD